MPKYDYIMYNLQVTTITPLHIGNGRELLRDYDYAVHNNQTWRINEAALLDAQDVDDPALADQLARTPPAQLLKPGDFRPDSPFFRYVIKGAPRSGQEGAQLREQLKDPFDRPYIPGSSLKGALRTAIAWHAWEALGLRPDVRKLKENRKWAAQDYEREIFGRDPNHDLLRALQVSDSQPVGPDCLMILNARVLNRNGKAASPIALEAIQTRRTFAMTMKLDLALFSDWARERGLNLRVEEWLKMLPQVVQQHAQDRMQREAAWFSQARPAFSFYKDWSHETLEESKFLLQIGWGTGWEGKTFGSRLQADKPFMEEIIRKYRLPARGKRQPGDPFPKSRRVMVHVLSTPQGKTEERPASPLGWVLVEMKEIK